MLDHRLRQSIKTHPRGAVPVKLSWLLRCVLRCLDDDTLASLQQYPERVARQSDGSSGDVTTSGSDIGAANTAQSGRHGSQKAAAAAGVGTGESARPHMPTGSSEEGLEDTRGGEEVGGTEDVIALLLSTDEARRAGKKSGATAGGRSLVTGGWPVVPAAPSDTGAGAVLGGILVPGTTGSVLNKRRRAQRQEQLLQEARRRRGGVMALDDSQPPPESEASDGLCIVCTVCVLFSLMMWISDMILSVVLTSVVHDRLWFMNQTRCLSAETTGSPV